MIIHDLKCVMCGTVIESVPCEFGRYGACECGGERTVTWEGGQPPATDVFGDAKFNRAFNREFTSTREAERYGQKNGWEPCADRVHGAPYMPEAYEPRSVPVHHQRASESGSGGARFEKTVGG